jgi:hypothetical protein
MAHYMPWYEADPARGRWGWHWTMNHFRPEETRKDGRREIASRLYPLIGPYDSNDPDALECHVLLMKLAGIDGVIIDWYGPDALLDYGLIHRNTEHLLQIVKKAGLKFAVMFEDQVVPKLREAGKLPGGDVVAYGRGLMKGVLGRWFADPAYLRTGGGAPALFVFGAGVITGSEWKQILAAAPQPGVHLFTEADRREPAVGGFDWPHPRQGTEGALREVDAFYGRARSWPESVPVAFPRFEDIYEQAGVHASWGRVEDRAGRTYADLLERALKSGAPVVQIATWNDWGEGTVVEPSVEYGYRDLEATQRLRRRHLDPKFPFTADDLRLPLRLYRARKSPRGITASRLDEASRFLFAGRAAQARRLLPGDPL